MRIIAKGHYRFTEDIKLLIGVKVFIKQFLHLSLAKAMKLDLEMQKR